MVDTGYTNPSIGKIVVKGEPLVAEKKVITAANVYPGRLLERDTTDNGIKVAGGINPVVGWCGYEQASPKDKAESLATVKTTSDSVPVLSGGGFAIMAKLAQGFASVEGDIAIPWSSGRVAPAIVLPSGGLAIRVPYTKNTSEKDTTIDFPTGMLLGLPQALPTVADASGTIDIGLLSSESGGDADGLADGLALPTAATWAIHNCADATAANITIGVLVDEVQLIDATGTPVYFRIMTSPAYQVGTTAVSLTYTTSNHTQSGYFFVPVASLGTAPVGKFAETISASESADQNAIVVSLI